jgi:hypothetical protein
MSTKGISSQIQVRRRSFLISGMAIRMFIAFIISLIIVLAFFASGVASH